MLSTKDSVSGKIWFKNEGEINTFPDKQKLSSSLQVDLSYKKC